MYTSRYQIILWFDNSDFKLIIFQTPDTNCGNSRSSPCQGFPGGEVSYIHPCKRLSYLVNQIQGSWAHPSERLSVQVLEFFFLSISPFLSLFSNLGYAYPTVVMSMTVVTIPYSYY